MYFFVDVFNYALSAILLGVTMAWMFLLKSMWITFRDSPMLDKFSSKPHQNPKVSVILPARNEEMFIEKCINSLLAQDYENYEIIVIDDRSEDSTGKIIKKMAQSNPKIVYVLAEPKPEGWTGKNWACIEGFRKSSGELLLFTDADTTHTPKIISIAVDHLLGQELDALTAIPKLLCLDWWTRITLPVLSTFLHTRFSALRVNDPAKKTGYFFGSFFIIKRKTYELAGTHEGVKSDIVEDGALGKKVKEQGFKLKMVGGQHLVDAVWARDWTTLWHALKRLMIPLYLQSNSTAVGIFFAVLFLLFVPFPALVYSIFFVSSSESFLILFWVSLLAIGLFYFTVILDAKKGLSLGFGDALFGPVGSSIIVAGFATGILHARRSNSLTWRGRTYSISETDQHSINL
jgi:cellulose synthase/poly-beta-1,6-N-acetylglucosamine synthase-like glycosyltransferase